MYNKTLFRVTIWNRRLFFNDFFIAGGGRSLEALLLHIPDPSSQSHTRTTPIAIEAKEENYLKISLNLVDFIDIFGMRKIESPTD